MRPLHFSIVSVVVFVISVAPLDAEVVPDVSAVRQAAKLRYRSGDYEEAMRLYHQIVKLDPKNLAALKEAMWGFWNMGHYDEAAKIAGQVRALQPDDAEAKNILSWAPQRQGHQEESSLRRDAVAAYQAGHYEDSARIYRELSQRAPDNLAIQKEFMWALWSTGRYDEASRVAQRVSALRPRETEATSVLKRAPGQITRQKIAALESQVTAQQDSGQPEQIIALYQDMLALEPENTAVLKSLIWQLFKQGNYEDAKTYAFQLMVLRRNDPESWNLLAKMQVALNQNDESILSYKRSLALDPKQPAALLAMGKYYVIRREFETALTYLEPAVTANSSVAQVYPLLAKAYFFSNQFAKARDAWVKAAEYYPEEDEYAFNREQSRYYAGDPDGAVTAMLALWKTHQNRHALDFVVDDLVARRDTAQAEKLMEESVPIMTDANEAWVMKLAALYQGDGRTTHLIALLDRFLAVWPHHQPSLSMKGSALYNVSRYDEARAVFLEYVHVNPASTVAWMGLAACEQALDHMSAATDAIAHLRRLDPTDPYALLLDAQTVYDSGHHDKARHMLRRWLRSNKNSPVVPVLLYHGLSPFERDPLLAYPYHQAVWIFDGQMRALHDAGFNPVTADEINEWLAGTRTLPPRPVLIAFDDNRRDSVIYADPILEKYHLKATMFVAITNIEYHQPPAFLSWDELRRYQKTGRWELQGHGDLAHIYIDANGDGGRGLFLMNRKWLTPENRLETIEEWTQRISADHESSIAKMTQQVGGAPTAYAWPEGLYGQQGNTNSPETSALNQTLIKKYFKAAYTQTQYGLNVQSQDPGHMTRIVPTNTWTGEDLLKHISDRSPFAMVHLQLLEWAVEAGHTREAFSWLSAMHHEGVTEPVLLLKESEIRFAAGDMNAGHAIETRLAMLENNLEVQKSIKRHEEHTGPVWTPTFNYQTDSNHRIGREFFQTLEIPSFKNITWRLSQLYGRYSEPGTPSITNNGLGAGLDANLGLFHKLSLDAMGHRIPDSSRDPVTGEGAIQSEWTDTFQTRFTAGRALIDTARALNDDIRVRYAQGMLRWTSSGWDFIARGRRSLISDDNDRWFGQGTIARDLNSEGSLRLHARFTYDAMKHVSPAYYSPQDLKQYQFGPEISKDLSKHVNFFVRYLPGYGIENNITTGQFVQDVETHLRLRFSDTVSLTPGFEYQSTPTYDETFYLMEFRCGF